LKAIPSAPTIAQIIAGTAILAWAAVVGTDLRDTDPIETRGGARFSTRIELPVTLMRQGDERWAAEQLGPTASTIESEGCAVASAAMALAFHGTTTDPSRLNRALTATPGGFTTNGWLYWEKAALSVNAPVVHAYEGPARYRLIDRNLARANPTIARVRLPSGTTHFVVICGKDKDQYLVRDPGAGQARHLSELLGPLEAVRFYLPKPAVHFGNRADNSDKLAPSSES